MLAAFARLLQVACLGVPSPSPGHESRFSTQRMRLLVTGATSVTSSSQPAIRSPPPMPSARTRNASIESCSCCLDGVLARQAGQQCPGVGQPIHWAVGKTTAPVSRCSPENEPPFCPGTDLAFSFSFEKSSFLPPPVQSRIHTGRSRALALLQNQATLSQRHPATPDARWKAAECLFVV